MKNIVSEAEFLAKEGEKQVSPSSQSITPQKFVLPPFSKKTTLESNSSNNKPISNSNSPSLKIALPGVKAIGLGPSFDPSKVLLKKTNPTNNTEKKEETATPDFRNVLKKN